MLNKFGKFGVCYMNISRRNLSSVSLEPKHWKSRSKHSKKNHSYPNNAKWEAKCDGMDNYKAKFFSKPYGILSVILANAANFCGTLFDKFYFKQV